MRWLLWASIGICYGCAAPVQQATQPKQPKPVAYEPPLVLNGKARLDCTISSRKNGRQRLLLSEGQGLEFDVAVSPIVDGLVQTRGNEQGGSYQFTSHLAQPGAGRLPGVGPVRIEKLETRVNVQMRRYQQPGGAGHELSFEASDMLNAGTYIEFTGEALDRDGNVYQLRVSVGAAGQNSGGRVWPLTTAMEAPIAAKVVMIDPAPVTTVAVKQRVWLQVRPGSESRSVETVIEKKGR